MLQGCIYDDTTSCNTKRAVRIAYTRNMKFADAASQEVKKVTLYAFDVAGKAVYQRTVDTATLQAADYAVDVSDLPEGIYTWKAWAVGEERYADSYEWGDAPVTRTALDDFSCHIRRDDEGNIRHDLTPLFYGATGETDFTKSPDGGDREATLDLMKNTNHIRVVLQQTSGASLDPTKFTFRITDDNGYMDADNNLLADDAITYYPWAVSGGSVETEGAGSATGVNVAIADFTVGRLMATGHRPVLTVQNEDGLVVFSIPVAQYALLIKGYYNSGLSDQEYLDRQDDYAMTFFLDRNGQWVSSSILINSWRVVLNNITI